MMQAENVERYSVTGKPSTSMALKLVFQQVSAVLQGVLNGIDMAMWDPATDTGIPAPFTIDDMTGKALCKR